MPRQRWQPMIWFTAFGAVGAACSSSASPVLPDAGNVARIEVRELTRSDEPTCIIADPKSVAWVVRLLTSEGRWSHPGALQMDYPTPYWGARMVSASGQFQFNLWFGPNWIGGSSATGPDQSNLFWDCDAKREEQLRTVLGVKIHGR